jgi:hypothetical protein
LCVVGRGAWGYANAMWARRRVVVVRRDGNNIVIGSVGVCLVGGCWSCGMVVVWVNACVNGWGNEREGFG